MAGQSQPDTSWHMKRNMMSKGATTNWEELAVVNA
ncbi:MAG: DUF4113 domain-containing protein [Candidatus Adiutrix sp.]|nr:DUF4113 domain-containing protein [Candidatus Adiutrix sp.]